MPDDSGVTLEYSSGHERLRLEAWGEDSIRVRAGQAHIAEDLPGALITPRPAPSAGASSNGDHAHQREAESSNLRRRAGELFELRRRPRVAFRAEGPLLVARAQAFPGQRQWVLPPGAALQSIRRRKALRPRPAPARAFRPEGPGHGPGAAQRRSLGTFHGLEQRLRFPLELPRRGPRRACRQRDSLGGGQRGANRLLGDVPATSRQRSSRTTPTPPVMRRNCLLGRAVFGRASSATGPRKSCWPWPGSTTGGVYRWR